MEISENARQVYRAMLRDSSLGVNALATEIGVSQRKVRAALDELLDLNLLRPDAAGRRAISPRLALAGFVATAEAELARTQERVSAARALLESVSAEYDALLSHEAFVVHSNAGVVRDRMRELSLSATRECLSINPGRAQTAESIEASKPNNEDALARGIRLRFIYQDSTRNDPATVAYAHWLIDRGGEARTRPTLPIKLVVIDRKVALLPRDPDRPDLGALEVRAPALVEALRLFFEMTWEAGEPLGSLRHREGGPSSATTREILRLLGTGATDEMVGHRLGLSARTVRRIVAEMMDSLGSASRFQAGAEAAKRGLLD